MEELLYNLKNKTAKTPRELAVIELYKQLGNYPPEEVTKDTKLFLISQVFEFVNLSFMNMKLMAAALVMIQMININREELNEKSFNKYFDLYVRKIFIPVENLESTTERKNYYLSIKIDILRYIRNIQLNINA